MFLLTILFLDILISDLLRFFWAVVGMIFFLKF